MSRHFEKIQTYYSKGIYKIEHLAKLVKSGAITEEEFCQITGQEFKEER